MRNRPTENQRALLDAIRESNADAVREILARDSSAAAAELDNGVSAVLLATYHRRPDIAEQLMAAGAKPGLYEAAALGRLLEVRDALRSDPESANSHAPDGHTPLGLACFFGHLEVAELLLSHGANPNRESRNFQRVAPLHSAAAADSLAIVKLLLDAGANPRKEQDTGFTALHSAAAHGNLEMVRLLLERGAKADARTVEGRTPVSYAAERGHHAVVDYLSTR